jgi:hypothetical protein
MDKVTGCRLDPPVAGSELPAFVRMKPTKTEAEPRQVFKSLHLATPEAQLLVFSVPPFLPSSLPPFFPSFLPFLPPFFPSFLLSFLPSSLPPLFSSFYLSFLPVLGLELRAYP